MQAMQRLSAYACACLSVCRADEEIVHKVQSNMATCEPAFRDAKVGRGQLPAAAPGGACGCYRAIASGARRLLPILHFLTPAAAPTLLLLLLRLRLPPCLPAAGAAHPC